MAHFAKVLNGKVTQVIVAGPEFFETFVDSTPGEWIQTSYNTRGGIHYDPITGNPSDNQSKSLRKNYAGIGYFYDSINEAFIPPKPYLSWILNEETFLWESPVPYPVDTENFYNWNETGQTWDLVTPE